MSKTIKRILAAVLAVALLIGGAWGVMILIRSLLREMFRKKRERREAE